MIRQFNALQQHHLPFTPLDMTPLASALVPRLTPAAAQQSECESSILSSSTIYLLLR